MARRGGQGNRGRRSSRNRSRSRSTKSSSRSTSSSRRGRRGGQGNRGKGFGRAKGTVSRKSIGKGLRSVKKAASRAGKGIGRSLRGAAANAASFAANHPSLSSYNRRTRDMSQLTPQSRRRYQRLSEKTGRDYSQRIPTMRINLSADRLAQLGGFADSRFYKGLTKAIPGIKSLQINKQLYSNPERKGWHSSQRTGRGQGLTTEAATRQQLSSFREDPYEADKEWYDKYNPLGITVSQAKKMYANQLKEGATLEQAMRSNKAETTFFDALIPDREEPRPIDTEQLPPDFGRPVRGIPDRGRPPRGGPEPDWLSQLYSSHNISGGKLDQGARDYWTNEAKTKGRDAVMQSIIDTSKAQGTYGGRKKPRRIDTGDGFPKAVPLPWFGASAGRGLLGGVKAAKSERRKAKKQNQATKRQYQYDKKAYNLQAKGGKRRMMKSLAAQIAGIRGGVG